MRRVLGLSIGAIWLAASLGAAPAQPAWDERFYNPAPAEDDLVLPLPCDGAIVFRPVATVPDTDDALGDQQVRLGSPDAASGHIDYLRRRHLLGAFPDGEHWVYYIGKYEVTRDQWRAVMGEGCPDPGMAGTLPQTDTSWFDAVAFTRTLSEWLFANAGDAVPSVGRYTGYVRLPTEAEWEFATRGGIAVDDEVFRAATFFAGEPAPEYVWFQGPTSARGSLKPVGVRKPNPLGLHDVLGNAEEFVLEPFRLNRVGRDHGQIGGFVTRGGSIRTPRAEVRNSLRTEYSFFDVATGEALELDTFGIRLLLSAPVGTSAERAEAVAEAWRARREADDGHGANEVDALALIEDVRGLVTDLEMAGDLADAAAALSAERRASEDVAARAVRRALLSGAIFGEVIDRQSRIRAALSLGVRRAERERRIARERGDEDAVAEWEASLADLRPRLDRAEADLTVQRRGFVETIYMLADDHRRPSLTAQSDLLAEELQLADRVETAEVTRAFADALLAYVDDPSLSGDELIDLYLERTR